MFLAGFIYKDYEGEKNRVWSTIIMALFGFFIVIISFVVEIYKLLEFPYVVKFYWTFYFTKFYDNMSKEDLEKINENIHKSSMSKYKKYANMIFKKNNFTCK